MPDRRKHRGSHPADKDLFAADRVHLLQRAVHDLSWLMSRSYATPSATKLVGDRYQLTDRQRMAVLRCACSDDSVRIRSASRADLSDLRGSRLAIDGFNLLTTIEVALSGGILLRGRDGCIRDVASMHGTYRRVEETIPALTLIGRFLADHDCRETRWLLDRPVSNSGRLKKIIGGLALQKHWLWDVTLDNNPDKMLISLQDQIVVSADSYVIENSERWVDISSPIIAGIEGTQVLDLGTLAEQQ